MVRHIVVLLVLVFLVIAPAANAQEGEDEAPYLYYYSTLLNGIVIERADGSDSRVIGGDVMPPETDTVYGEWSPTGEWFAWRSGVDDGPGYSTRKAWIISADGSNRLTMLDNLRDVQQMAWSPVEDLLFLRDSHSDRDMKTNYLINVPTGDLITSFTTTYGVSSSSSIRWTPDGSYVVFFYDQYREEAGERVRRTFLRSVSRTGEISDRQVGSMFNSVYRTYPNISSRNEIIYLNPDETQIIVEILNTGETRNYEMLPDHIRSIEWSPGGAYALVFTQATCDEGYSCAGLWLLSEAGLEQVDTQIQYYDYRPRILWSPVEDIAYFITTDGELHILHPDEIDIDTAPETPDIKSAFWLADGPQLYISTGTDTPGYLYEVASNEVVTLEALANSDPYNFSTSSSGRYFALGIELALVDTYSGQVLDNYIKHSAATFGGTGSYSIFSPNEEWFIHNQIISYAGGGGGPSATMVYRVDRRVRRELNVAFNSARWLPENVIPHLSGGSPDSVLTEPVYTLVHDELVFGTVWSPDGTQVASYTEGTIHIWDVNETGVEEVKSFEVEPTRPCGEYLFPCDMAWSADGRLITTGVNVWDIETGEQVDQLLHHNGLWIGIVREREFTSPDGQYIARWLPGPEITVEDVASGALLHTISLEDYADIAWVNNSKLLLFRESRPLRTFDVNSGELTSFAGEIKMGMLGIHAQSELIGYASNFRRTTIWPAPDTPVEINWYANAIDFSPDGRWLAAANTQLVTIWDLDEVLGQE